MDWYIVKSPTATGKTYIGLVGLFEIYKDSNENIKPIFLAYSRIATFQAQEKLNELFISNLVSSNFNKIMKQNIVTIHSFLRAASTNESIVIVVDEAHHLSKKAEFQKQLKNFKNLKLLIGLTGTPRLDYDKDGFNKNIFSIDRADTGLRFPTITKMPLEVTSREAEEIRIKKDYSECENTDELSARLDSDESKLNSFLNFISHKVYDNRNNFKKAIIFYPFEEGNSSIRLLKKINERFGYECALPIYSKETSSDSSLIEILNSFKSQDSYKILIGDKMLDEALDIPSIDAIFMTKPTMSDIKYSQMVGRAIRICKGKDEVKIYDFRDNYKRFHSNVSQQDYLFKGSRLYNFSRQSREGNKIEAYVPYLDPIKMKSIIFDQLEYYGIINNEKIRSDISLSPVQVSQFLHLLCFSLEKNKDEVEEYFTRFLRSEKEMNYLFQSPEVSTTLSNITGNPLEVPLVKELIKPLLNIKFNNSVRIEREFPLSSGERIDLLIANEPSILFEFGIDDVCLKYNQILNYKRLFEKDFQRKISECWLIGTSYNGNSESRIVDDKLNIKFVNWSDFFIDFCEVEKLPINLNFKKSA